MGFDSAYLATGIGSFPHTSGEAAFRLILDNFPGIPFWPQFPKRSFLEGMVLQYSEGFPSLKWDLKAKRVWVDTAQDFDRNVETFYQHLETGNLDPFAITEQFSKGFSLVDRLTKWEGRHEISYVKGQITGPVTFGLSLTDREQKPSFYDPTLREILIQHLCAKARWMEKRFNDLLPETKTLLFFDEPSLSSFGSAFSGLSRDDVILSLNQCLGAVKGLKGVHCCGNTDWGLLLDTDLDVLSFDAYGYLETVALYPQKINAFLQRGGILAWGIVPTSEDVLNETGESLARRFEAGQKTLAGSGIDEMLLRRALITPSCGVASLSLALAERACRLASEVSKKLRGQDTG